MNALVIDRIQRSFDRSFHSYHDSATQQAGIAQLLARRLARLGAPKQFDRVFEIGCGTGHLTDALRDRFDMRELILNDLVSGAHLTAQRARARFVAGDARQVAWPSDPDLLVSASTFQWMEAPGKLIARAGAALRPGGWLAISSFGPAQYQELAVLGSAAGAPGLCEPDALAQGLGSGFEVLELRGRVSRLWFDDPRDVLRYLRRTGVNAKASRNWTKARLAQFCDDYVGHFGVQGRVPLTYNPIWIIGRKTG